MLELPLPLPSVPLASDDEMAMSSMSTVPLTPLTVSPTVLALDSVGAITFALVPLAYAHAPAAHVMPP